MLPLSVQPFVKPFVQPFVKPRHCTCAFTPRRGACVHRYAQGFNLTNRMPLFVKPKAKLTRQVMCTARSSMHPVHAHTHVHPADPCMLIRQAVHEHVHTRASG